MRNIIGIAILLLVGCTDSPHGPSSVTATGTIGAIPLHLQSVGAHVTTDDKGSFVIVALSPFADACAAPAVTSASNAAIELVLYKQGAGGALVAATDPGTYTSNVAGAGPYAEIDAFARDASCAPTDGDGKGDGTVTLTQADATGYTGTFDFTLSGGSQHVTGSFTSGVCAEDIATTACQ